MKYLVYCVLQQKNNTKAKWIKAAESLAAKIKGDSPLDLKKKALYFCLVYLFIIYCMTLNVQVLDICLFVCYFCLNAQRLLWACTGSI